MTWAGERAFEARVPIATTYSKMIVATSIFLPKNERLGEGEG